MIRKILYRILDFDRLRRKLTLGWDGSTYEIHFYLEMEGRVIDDDNCFIFFLLFILCPEECSICR
jgi:hypothetical protein